MLFNSLDFLLFFPVVCVIYFLIPSRHTDYRNLFLLVASYYFYMNWEPVYALLIFTSTVVTYFAALGIEQSREMWGKKLFLFLSLIINLGILFLFKYYNFIGETLESLFCLTGLSISIPSFKLLLPVGISFYTFQALGYSIDVYRGTTKVEKHFPTYALFVSFFPQLVAGPIERSSNLLPQFKERHKFDYEQVMSGICLMIWGYFLKLALADRCGIYVDMIYNNISKHNGGSYLVASLLFPFQIYGDFAGYSCIAIGAAKVIGFRLMNNFNRPYFATTVGEFWHRWHISLSTWFKDYVYIPLGGNRVPKWRNYLNLMITFLVSGLWHGANWTFVCWGGLHGLLQCVEKALGFNSKRYKGFTKVCHWLLTFFLVCVAWVFFRANSIGDTFTIFRGIITNFALPRLEWATFIAIGMASVIVITKECIEECGWRIQFSKPGSFVARHLYIVFMVSYIVLFGVLNSDQFIYFQF